MTLQSTPAWCRVLSTPEITDRNVLRSAFSRTGAMRYGDFKIQPTATTRQFSAAPGRAFILGQEISLQGGYMVWNAATENLTVAAPAASPVIDTVLIRVYDEQYGTLPSGTSRAQWDIIRGTPNASPVALPDSSFLAAGANYVPGAFWRVADIRTNPGDTTIPAGQIYQPLNHVRVPGGITLCNSTASTTGFGGRPSDPVLGDVIFEVDTGLTYRWSGSLSKWMRDEVILDIAADQSWTSTTTFTDVTGFSAAVEANSRYAFDFNVGVIGIAAAGLAIQLVAPTASRLDGSLVGISQAGAAFNGWTQNGAATQSFGTWGQSLQSTRITGVVTTGANAGTFKMQAAQGTSNASASWVLRGSTMRYRQTA